MLSLGCVRGQGSGSGSRCFLSCKQAVILSRAGQSRSPFPLWPRARSAHRPGVRSGVQLHALCRCHVPAGWQEAGGDALSGGAWPALHARVQQSAVGGWRLAVESAWAWLAGAQLPLTCNPVCDHHLSLVVSPPLPQLGLRTRPPAPRSPLPVLQLCPASRLTCRQLAPLPRKERARPRHAPCAWCSLCGTKSHWARQLQSLAAAAPCRCCADLGDCTGAWAGPGHSGC